MSTRSAGLAWWTSPRRRRPTAEPWPAARSGCFPRRRSRSQATRSTRATFSGRRASPAYKAAKRTADLIPLCHPLLVGSVYVNFTIGDDFVEVETQVEAVDRTGVEMEALTACAVAALTIYDMCKSADRSMVVEELCLWEKTGGRSGVWRRTNALVRRQHPPIG